MRVGASTAARLIQGCQLCSEIMKDVSNGTPGKNQPAMKRKEVSKWDNLRNMFSNKCI
jgi:hypothetical protein